MSDKELIDYCEMHSLTSVGLIHKGMIRRLLELAGQATEWVERQEWWALDAYVMKELCDVARLRLLAGDAA